MTVNDALDNDIQYIFSTCTMEELKLSADITDQYVEDNTAIQDNMAIKPLQFTLKGFVAEKFYNRKAEAEKLGLTNKIANTFSKLSPVASLSPTLSSYMQSAVATSTFIEANVNKIVKSVGTVANAYKALKGKSPKDMLDIINNLKDKTGIENQYYAVQRFESLLNSRTPVTVANAMGIFENLYITSVSVAQGDSPMVSEIIVTLKQLRFTSTVLSYIDYKTYADRYAVQQAEEENLGKIQGKQENMTIKYKREHGIE